MIGVSCVAPIDPPSKIELKLAMMMNPKPEWKEVELQDALVKIVKELLRDHLVHCLKESLSRSRQKDQALGTILLTLKGEFRKIKFHLCFKISQVIVAIKA